MWISYLGSDPYGVGGTARSAVPGQPIAHRSKRHNQFHLSWSQYWDRHQGLTGPTGSNGIDVPHCGSLEPATEEPPTMSITTIGLDTAKSVFQIHGVNEAGKAELKRKVRRSDLIAFFEEQERCTEVMEACVV